MKILIGADLVPTDINAAAFVAGDAQALVGQPLLDILRCADYRIFNLEVPLSDKQAPIKKCGPALRATENTIAGYQALGVDCLTIANNHIMDQGTQGFSSTVQALDAAGIAHVGGGKNIEDAEKPHIFDVAGKRFGIYACAEHEFSVAGEDAPGANPFDPLETPDHIAALKAQCDYVIVLYHGGKEHYRYPSPGLQKTCRKLVQKGADLVICQHSHCIGCEEKYLHGTIVYGQGNFLFDYDGSDFKGSGVLVAIGEGFSLEYIPFIRDETGLRLASGEQARELLEAMNTRSREITDPQFIKRKYADFAKIERSRYLIAFSSVNDKHILLRILNKLSGYRLTKWLVCRKYKKNKLLIMRNFVECETQRELFLAGLTTDERQ